MAQKIGFLNSQGTTQITVALLQRQYSTANSTSNGTSANSTLQLYIQDSNGNYLIDAVVYSTFNLEGTHTFQVLQTKLAMLRSKISLMDRILSKLQRSGLIHWSNQSTSRVIHAVVLMLSGEAQGDNTLL